MDKPILIAGHGLAGALLAWQCERAGLDFAVADPGGGGSASLAGAGLINPITGRRLVPAWRFGEFMPCARAVYREIEAALGVPLWHELRVRRLFADAGERAAFAARHGRGGLAPHAGAADAAGFWIDGAARVDVAALLAGLRERWRRAGRWRAEAVEPVAELARHAAVIDCAGAAAARAGRLRFVAWEFAKGERLELAVDGLEAGIVLNRRQWLLPVAPGRAWVGATHEPGVVDPAPSPAARALLVAAARGLAGDARPLAVTAQHAGVRVASPDRRPAIGWHPAEPRLGLINGLGGRGALWAPMLARAWARHLAQGEPFPPECGVARFAGGASIAAGGDSSRKTGASSQA
ncbi:MAG: FAD-dependent oxidoreductase [Opitutaceae bacterium]|nr:FAD-dependent oxidoreductase [Opitutaceae bacterium]